MSIPAEDIERARDANILEVAQRYTKLKRSTSVEWEGPCPVCGGKNRFASNDRKNTWNCRGCKKGGDTISLVMRAEGCGFVEAIEKLTDGAWRPSAPRRTHIAAASAKAADDRAEREKAQWFWRRRQPIIRSIAETYLRQARGYGGEIPATLGFLPATKEHAPALIAAFGIQDVMAVQLIKLKPDGSDKADVDPNKIIIGRGALGSPIVLAAPNDLNGLAIAEGIEDALSIHEATGLGAWASGGAGRMPALADAVPDTIDCVNIFGDDDDTGRAHAPELAARLRARGVVLKFLRARSRS